MLSDIRTGTVKVPRPTRKTKSEQWPNSWKSSPFSQIAGRLLLLIQFSSVTLCEPMDCTWRHNSLPVHHYEIQFSSVTQSCATLCDPMDCRKLGLPVHHQLLELTQTHVHQVGDAIQPSHLLLSPSPPTLNPSQHQGLSNDLVLCIRWPKYWSFSFSISQCQWIFRTDFL